MLVADDDPDILALVRFRLERDGYEVLSAPDGEAALDLALARAPDLALLDVMMPRLDGYEVTRRLREHGPTTAIPIILLTARVQEPDVARGHRGRRRRLRDEAVQPAGARRARSGRRLGR